MSRRRREANEQALEREIHDALRSLGWIGAESDQDVFDAEEAFARSPIDLPKALCDPKAVFDRSDQDDRRSGPLIPFPGDPSIDSTLSRAAREGGGVGEGTGEGEGVGEGTGEGEGEEEGEGEGEGEGVGEGIGEGEGVGALVDLRVSVGATVGTVVGVGSWEGNRLTGS